MSLALPSATRFRTKQEFVYRTLRDAIMSCELAPGQRLVIDDLARRLEVSAIPVREALQLLQSEGLVQNVPHVGATVSPISRESIDEVFTVMEGLEIVATRGAARRMSPEDAEALATIVTAMDEAARGRPARGMGRPQHPLPPLDQPHERHADAPGDDGAGAGPLGPRAALLLQRACSCTGSSRPRASTASSSRP